jgi:hypothetical protein
MLPRSPDAGAAAAVGVLERIGVMGEVSGVEEEGVAAKAKPAVELLREAGGVWCGERLGESEGNDCPPPPDMSTWLPERGSEECESCCW